MPRITAASVAEHVAEQEAAVLTTAIRLFTERGYDRVTIGDIATEIGLKRNSLYRYFPDKAHILVRWFQQELPRQIERSARVLESDDPAPSRIEAWALDQLEYAASPEHELITRISTIIPELDPSTRDELMTSHDHLIRPLLETLAEAGVTAPEEQRVVATLMQQLVLSAARIDSPDAPDRSDEVREYLLRAIRGLLTPAP
ncbi:TetR/AcrR family transcriptional regulator [Gordonia sp. CPCC 206044]|uniref:TetR/AcrR family transcriptional regulator n=1 Tax=Gordonia sp. CPCC 206044 TaxID=3140793 RepID=UPI003AF35444